MAKMGAPYGIKHGKAIVLDSTVKEIRDRYYDKGHTVRKMAKEYGISENTIWDWIKYFTRVHST